MNKKRNIGHPFWQFILSLVLFSFVFPTFGKELNLIQFWQGVNTVHVRHDPEAGLTEQNRITSIFYNRWYVGSFINSFSKRSEILGYHYWYYPHRQEDWFYHYGVSIAVATGYGRKLASNIDGRLTFGLSPFAGGKFFLNQKWAIGADVLYIPTDDGGVFVTGLNINYAF